MKSCAVPILFPIFAVLGVGISACDAEVIGGDGSGGGDEESHSTTSSTGPSGADGDEDTCTGGGGEAATNTVGVATVTVGVTGGGPIPECIPAPREVFSEPELNDCANPVSETDKPRAGSVVAREVSPALAAGDLWFRERRPRQLIGRGERGFGCVRHPTSLPRRSLEMSHNEYYVK